MFALSVTNTTLVNLYDHKLQLAVALAVVLRMLSRAMMTEPAGRVLEGVFAVKKPPSLSSAQVIRDLQHAFRSSRVFAGLLNETLARDAQNKHRSKRRRIDNDNVFKMGHGGTLDPMATGVLIVGIGRGTKSLHDFLNCTKTYETVVLFGKSTDTYDVAGKIVATGKVGHITKEMVEKQLEGFRGDIKQVPPIYSALKIDGMKAYDYARSGKELPRELAARDMRVSECTLTDWFAPGEHNFHWPAAQAPQEERDAFQKLVARSNVTYQSIDEDGGKDGNSLEEEESFVTAPDVHEEAQLNETSAEFQKNMSREEKATLHTHQISSLSDMVADAPAARVRLTVSSGFYVRSFAHDLGVACGSYATMAELARTRQAEYSTSASTGDLVPSIDHADFQRGEDIWGPKITKVLDDWLAKHPAPEQKLFAGRNSEPKGSHRKQGKFYQEKRARKRRNSSSPESN